MTNDGIIRVLIADDHAIVREGVRQVLASDGAFEVVAEARTGLEVVQLARDVTVDVIVLDLSMPGLSGLDSVARIRETAPDTKVLVLSIHDHEEYVLQSVRAGARGYLRKDSSPAELRDAVRIIHEGGTYFSAPVARTLSDALRNEHGMGSLTARERDVLVAIARGATNKEIGAGLGISVRTVESHREALMRKLNLKGAASLTRFAIDAGLLDTPR